MRFSTAASFFSLQIKSIGFSSLWGHFFGYIFEFSSRRISFCSPGGDGLFEHVGGGVGRAEAREADRHPHPGDPVQERSPTGLWSFLQMSGCAIKILETGFTLFSLFFTVFPFSQI